MKQPPQIPRAIGLTDIITPKRYQLSVSHSKQTKNNNWVTMDNRVGSFGPCFLAQPELVTVRDVIFKMTFI